MQSARDNFNQLAGAVAMLEQIKTQLETTNQPQTNNEHSTNTSGSSDRSTDVRPGIESESSRDR